MNIGDRVVVQKDYKIFKNHDVCTIVDKLDDDLFMVRYGEKYISLSKDILRKITNSELKNVNINDVVHSSFLNGNIYVVSNKDINIEDIEEGDMCLILDVMIDENENNDIFLLDFGNKKLSLSKVFIENHMTIKNYNEEDEIDDCENNEIFDNNIYMENKNEEHKDTMSDLDVIIKLVAVGNYDFEINESKEIVLSHTINLNNIDKYIDSLKKLKSFLYKTL